MADDFSGTTTPLAAPPTFTANGVTQTCAPGDTTLVYLLSYMQAVANNYAAGAWNAPGVAPGYQVVKNIFPWDPDEAGVSESYLPAMFLWCPSIGPAYRRADDYFVRECKLRLLWVPQFPPGQDKQKTRGPFGKGLHAILVQYLDALRDPSWLVAGDPDMKAAKLGSLISNFAKFYYLHFMSWKPIKWIEKGMAPGVEPLVFDAFEGELDMLELWDVDLGRFDLLSGGLVETLTSTDDPPRIIGRGSNT